MPKGPRIGGSRIASQASERRARGVGDCQPSVARGVAEGAHVHSDHRGEDAERKRLLIILMRDEYACTVEDPYRRWPASGVPHAIGVRGDSKLGGERRLRTRQGFPTRTEGLWWHGPDHHAIGGRDRARRTGRGRTSVS